MERGNSGRPGGRPLREGSLAFCCPLREGALAFCDDDFGQLQAGVPAAGEVDGPVAGEYQQISATVVFQKLSVTTQIQIGKITGVAVNETDLW